MNVTVGGRSIEKVRMKFLIFCITLRYKLYAQYNASMNGFKKNTKKKKKKKILSIFFYGKVIRGIMGDLELIMILSSMFF